MVKITKTDINNIRPKWGRMLNTYLDDYQCLFDHCQGYDNYIEIGTMFGTSAIVAGYGVTGQVHCIDPFGVKGNATKKDKSGFFVKPEYVRENWAQHHAPERLVIHKQKHPPWPTEADFMFDIGLIDGDHDVEAVKNDWQGMSQHVKHKILFHDVNNKRRGALTEYFNKITKLPDWELVEIRGTMGALRRMSY